VIVPAEGLFAEDRERGDAGLTGLTRSGTSRDNTLPFEQIGHSAVKRL
jgi:hypothetical protein